MSSSKTSSQRPRTTPSATALPDVSTTKRVTSRELLGEGDQLVIEHEGREYRLRRTQSGKLIMTA